MFLWGFSLGFLCLGKDGVVKSVEEDEGGWMVLTGGFMESFWCDF